MRESVFLQRSIKLRGPYTKEDFRRLHARTLDDMTKEEKLAIEKKYGCKIIVRGRNEKPVIK